MKNYFIMPEILSVEQQFKRDIAMWMYDSHFWDDKMYCKWCGLILPTAWPLTEKTISLCPENPKVKKLIEKALQKCQSNPTAS